MKEKYIATLVGCAVGDSLGMVVEGWKREQIIKYVGRVETLLDPVIPIDKDGNEIKEDEFGKIKTHTRNNKKGDFTDDTILTLVIADSIIDQGKIDLEDIARKHLDAYKIRLKEDGSVIGGFGGTTIDALKNLQKGVSYLESGVIWGPGNAPAMKMHPVGMYMHATNNYDNGLRDAENISKITHLDPRSIVSGVLQAHAVYSLLNGIGRKEFLESLVELCDKNEKPLDERFKWHNSGSLGSRINWINENKDAENFEAFETLGNSSAVYKSYPFSIFMFQKYWDNPMKGLIETINYGGDCDTTGAIYGALAGAKNGMIFPEEIVNGINEIDRIKNVGERIFELSNKLVGERK